MRLKDKDFVLARETYENRYASGDMSVAVVMPLARVYLYYGELDRALALLERFVSMDPGNAEALALLGRHYRSAQRMGMGREGTQAYVKVLERLADFEIDGS